MIPDTVLKLLELLGYASGDLFRQGLQNGVPQLIFRHDIRSFLRP